MAREVTADDKLRAAITAAVLLMWGGQEAEPPNLKVSAKAIEAWPPASLWRWQRRFTEGNRI